MTDSTTPAAPEPESSGFSEAPQEPTETPGLGGLVHDGVPATPPVAPEPPAAQPASGGRGGCMTTMIGLFALIAAILGIALS